MPSAQSSSRTELAGRADGSGFEAHRLHTEHDKEAAHSIAMFRRKFWLSLALILPTVVWGDMLQRTLRYTAPPFPGATWIPPVFRTTVFGYGGWVFIEGQYASFALVYLG